MKFKIIHHPGLFLLIVLLYMGNLSYTITGGGWTEEQIETSHPNQPGLTSDLCKRNLKRELIDYARFYPEWDIEFAQCLWLDSNIL